MAYCVNCGVELQTGEPRCPLCGIESVNPLETGGQGNGARPYPRHVESLNRHIDRRYTAACVSLALLIPLFICAFCDLAANSRLTWSVYVLGGLGVAFVWILLPFFFVRRSAIACVLWDAAAAAGMLLLTERLMDDRWFLTLGLPLTGFAAAFALLGVGLCSKRLSWSALQRMALGAIGLGALTVLVECILMLHSGAFTLPRWSAYAFFPLLIIGGALLLLDRREGLKEQIRRRFFI